MTLSLSACISGKHSAPDIETTVSDSYAANYVKSNPVANELEGIPEEDPFTSYTYNFTVGEDNYMITVEPDESRTGLVLTLEDKDFGFTTFDVVPPEGYSVYLPYSQEDASTVCTVIHETESKSSLPDILKIDFYLSSFEDEDKPYTVCRLYTVVRGELKEFSVYDLREAVDEAEENTLSSNNGVLPIGYIPESDIFSPEPGKFMADPKVTVLEDGSLEADVVTYELDMTNSRIYCRSEPCGTDQPLYYGYAVYAIAKNISQYFKDTSLNVSDYENYVEIPSADGTSSQYFFKVDDPRFSTVAELRAYVGKYFAKDIVDELFLSAPQQYRDIEGELYTIVGDGGFNESLGRVFITEMEEPENDPNTITYHTKQEKFNEEHEMTGYIDGGDLTVQITDGDPGFLITKYRYPNS